MIGVKQWTETCVFCTFFVANDKWPQFTRLQSNGLSGVRTMLESYYKLPPKPKLVPEFKDAFQLIWPALPKKIIEL